MLLSVDCLVFVSYMWGFLSTTFFLTLNSTSNTNIFIALFLFLVFGFHTIRYNVTVACFQLIRRNRLIIADRWRGESVRECYESLLVLIDRTDSVRTCRCNLDIECFWRQCLAIVTSFRISVGLMIVSSISSSTVSQKEFSRLGWIHTACLARVVVKASTTLLVSLICNLLLHSRALHSWAVWVLCEKAWCASVSTLVNRMKTVRHQTPPLRTK